MIPIIYFAICYNISKFQRDGLLQIAITKISIILQSIVMTNMKLQWIYYYNDLIPIILQSIVRKKYEKFNYYNKYTVAIIWTQIIFVNSLQSIVIKFMK